MRYVPRYVLRGLELTSAPGFDFEYRVYLMERPWTCGVGPTYVEYDGRQ